MASLEDTKQTLARKLAEKRARAAGFDPDQQVTFSRVPALQYGGTFLFSPTYTWTGAAWEAFYLEAKDHVDELAEVMEMPRG